MARHPAHIQALLDIKDNDGLQAEMLARYGFRLSDNFVTDLRKYVSHKHKGLPALVESKDVGTVRDEYKALYGQEISDQYAGDLIAYFEKSAKGDSADG